MVKLKPCPFCGSVDLFFVSGSTCWWSCNNCDCMGPTKAKTQRTATKYWNKRMEEKDG